MKAIRALWRVVLGLFAAAVVVLAAQVPAAAAGPDLVDARLQGAWKLTVTVASYTGPQQTQNRPVGHQATDRVWFESTCPSPGSCRARIWGPNGPDPSAPFFQYFSNSSGFEGTPASAGLQQSGATYSVDIPIGGFGGFLKCPPPSGIARPAQHLSLRVVDAKQTTSGWQATTVTGTESLVAGWACNGSQPTAWVAVNLSIVGHPVGYVAPAAAHGPALTVSSLARSLNSPKAAFQSPALIVANLVVTALVILFVTFPSALFNHTLTQNYTEIATVAKRFSFVAAAARRQRGRLARLLNERRRELAIFVIVLAAGSLINGLLDPAFGFNGSSVTSYAATLVTLVYGVAMSALVAFAYRRARGRKTDWRFEALPLGLAIAAVCVLLSRITRFQPGYFYGLVVGIGFGTHMGKREDGHEAALKAVLTMVTAVAAWFAWSLVNPLTTRVDAGWPLVLLDDFLASVFVGGLVGNVIGLLPLSSLQGGKLMGWHRAVWAVIFAVAVFGLVQVLLHPEQGAVHPSQAPLVTAIALFVGFGGASVAFNRYFAWKGRPTRLLAASQEHVVAEPKPEPAVLAQPK